MDDYPSNSNRAREAAATERTSTQNSDQRLKPVVKNKAQIREKSELEKILSLFVNPEVTDWKDYILRNVVVPAVKTFVSDIIDNSKNAILWNGQNRSNNNIYSAGNMNYWRGSNGYQSNAQQQANYGYMYNDPYVNQANNREIVVRTYQDGIDVLNAATSILNSQGYLTVLQLFDLSGNGNMTYPTDQNYGWYDIRGAHVTKMMNGMWCIKTPRIIPLTPR